MSGMGIVSSYDKACDFSRGLFTPARDEAEARAIATRLKTSGKVDLIKPL